MAQSRIKAQASTANQLDSACSCTETIYDSAKQSNLLLGAGSRGVSLHIYPPAPLRGTSVLDSDQDRFYQIPEPPPLPPTLRVWRGRLAYLGSFCRSFFNQNFQSNFHPILMRFCLQLGLQNPPKIHPKSISRVS